MSGVEAHLFAAYEAATRSFRRQRSDIVGPPRLTWTGNTLAIEPEAGTRTQSLRVTAVPTPFATGRRVSSPPPWPERVAWSCGGIERTIPAGPGEDEVLVFDEASGLLIARVGPADVRVELTAERHVVVAPHPFSATSFGPALPARDATCHLAWTEAGDGLSFLERDRRRRADLELARPVEPALWVEALVLGRGQSRPLYAADGRLHLRIDPDVGGPERVIRARIGASVRYADLAVGRDGLACLNLAALGFDAPGDPVRVTFEALAPGAPVGDLETRAELAVVAWIWPGLTGEA
jgi:hypothetical protein